MSGVSRGVQQDTTTGGKKRQELLLDNAERGRRDGFSVTVICEMQASDHNGRTGGKSGEVINEIS